MYLELSRPRGEVGRWEKVFERLSLFNEFVPSRSCKISKNPFKGGLNKSQTLYTLNYIIENKRIFAGADLLDFYNAALKTGEQKNNWLFTSKKPILFFSNDTTNDAKQIREELNFLHTQSNRTTNSNRIIDNNYGPNASIAPITIKTYSSRGVDLIPSMKVITQGKKSLVFIIDHTACSSYFNIPINDGKVMRIASMDTLITLYFGLGLFDSNFFDMGSMECLANKLVEISIKARENPDRFVFPFISIKCTGHQTSLPSLIREKVKRITQKKQELKKLLMNQPIMPQIRPIRPIQKRNNYTVKLNHRL